MKNKIVTIKQKGDYSLMKSILNKGDFTGEIKRLPMSVASHTAKRNIDRTFITGFEGEDKDRKMYEKLLGVDLSPSSSYWEDARMFFSLPTGQMDFNISSPENDILYRMAIANKYLAPDRETLMDDVSFRECDYYVFDKDTAEEKKSAINELRDDISAEIVKFRNNKDKLNYLLSALGETVRSIYSVNTLYNMLSEKKNKLQRKEELEKFLAVLKTPNKELQAMYYVQQGIQLSLIVLDKTIGKFKYVSVEKIIARTKPELIAMFCDSANEESLSLLASEVESKRAM